MVKLCEKVGTSMVSDAVRVAIDQYVNSVELKMEAKERASIIAPDLAKILAGDGYPSKPLRDLENYAAGRTCSQPDGIGPHEREFGHMPCWDTNPAHHKQCAKCCACKKKK